MRKLIYFDNAATTRMDERVLQEMMPFFTEEYGNPDSVHLAAKAPSEAVELARKRVEKFLHTSGRGKIIFTSGGTESNNTVFRLCNSRHPMAMHILTSQTEHKSVLEPANACKSSMLHLLDPGRKGYVTVEDLIADGIPNYILISLMYMNNETGVINEVDRAGAILASMGREEVYFHIDCVQAAGAIPINVEEMHADLVSVSSHKIHGPKGVGCLWVSDRLLNRLNRDTLQLIIGGGQQGGLRSGTLDVPGIVGFGKAAEIAESELSNVRRKICDVSNAFTSELRKQCSMNKIRMNVNFPGADHHDPKVLSIAFPGADSETVVMVASENGLCISNGAACNSVSSEPSYVLLSSGLSPDAARNTVRVSFSKFNTVEEAKLGAEILVNAVREVISLKDSVA